VPSAEQHQTPQPARRRRLERSERREEILNAAKTLFAGSSAASVGIDQVAEAAGVSRALVYEYFGDRSKLLEEVRKEFVREFQALLDDAATTTQTARELLLQFVAAHLRFASRGEGAYRLATQDSARGIRWLSNYFGGSAEAHVIAAAAAESLRAFATEWASRGDLSIDRAAELAFTFVNGGLLAVRALGVKAPSSRQVAADVAALGFA